MHNWSTDTSTMSDGEKEVFELEQQINYGLNGKKLSKTLLLKYLGILSIDPSRRLFLEKLLHATNS